MSDLFNAELEASRSLVDLIEQAKKCQSLYERANMALPEPLRRVLGMNGSGGGNTVPSNITPPEKPPMPSDALPDWIWIPVIDAMPTSVVTAILRTAKAPLRPKEIIERVTQVAPEIPAGTIYNVGPRLERRGVIRRNEAGWELADIENAGVIHKGYLWGAPAVFEKQELASQRRAALLYILGFHPTGLQIVQIVQQLKRCPWVVAPINKDLLKEDIAVLFDEGRIRRRGNTRNWELTKEKD
jgi:hypothetical protein